VTDEKGTSVPDYRLFDADNHYYEAEDAFTRYLDRDMAKRAVQWAVVDGKKKLLVGGKVCNFIPNPTFDPIAKPGTLQEFFKGKAKGGVKEMFGDLEPIRPEYRDRDARLAVMDEQGIEAVWLFPTLGVGIEEALVHDPGAAMAAFTAFNRWLEDDWGYAYQERIFAAPYLCLMDLDKAVAELDRVLAAGARVICLRPAAVRTPAGSNSPFVEEYDGFWGRVNESGVTVAFHGGDSGYARFVKEWEPNAQYRAFFATPLERLLTGSRPITDAMGALLCHRLLERHPRIRIASIENGAGWARSLLKKVDLAAAQTPGWFKERPSETFRRHVWVSPFWEENPVRAVEHLTPERTLFGSDWPHTEGIAEPRSYLDSLTSLPDDDVRRIMRDNALELSALALQPVG
jgi:predicted TIM-barrel fold metal-dependent hydrolase